jgi:hypothetical protein
VNRNLDEIWWKEWSLSWTRCEIAALFERPLLDRCLEPALEPRCPQSTMPPSLANESPELLAQPSHAGVLLPPLAIGFT